MNWCDFSDALLNQLEPLRAASKPRRHWLRIFKREDSDAWLRRFFAREWMSLPLPSWEDPNHPAGPRMIQTAYGYVADTAELRGRVRRAARTDRSEQVETYLRSCEAITARAHGLHLTSSQLRRIDSVLSNGPGLEAARREGFLV